MWAHVCMLVASWMKKTKHPQPKGFIHGNLDVKVTKCLKTQLFFFHGGQVEQKSLADE